MLDLVKIRGELQAATAQPRVDLDLAIAVVSDLFRLADKAPPDDKFWSGWRKDGGTLWPEQVAMLAHCLMFSSLREESSAALRNQKLEAAKGVGDFFVQVAPLTAEMIRNNGFRQEEFLRKWAALWGMAIAGESEDMSMRRLESLDYRKTLDEYKRAESARAAEKAKRLEADRIAREAAEREAAARGWRE